MTSDRRLHRPRRQHRQRCDQRPGFKIDKTAPVISDAARRPPERQRLVQHRRHQRVQPRRRDLRPRRGLRPAFPSDAQSKTTIGEGLAVSVTSDPLHRPRRQHRQRCHQRPLPDRQDRAGHHRPRPRPGPNGTAGTTPTSSVTLQPAPTRAPAPVRHQPEHRPGDAQSKTPRRRPTVSQRQPLHRRRRQHRHASPASVDQDRQDRAGHHRDGPTTRPNANGWNNTDVTDGFSLDAGSPAPTRPAPWPSQATASHDRRR